MDKGLLLTLIATGVTWGATVLGSAMVFVFHKGLSEKLQKIMLGFAAGVMLTASIWSLLLPAMEMSREANRGIMPVILGFITGGLFLAMLDRVMPHFHIGSHEAEGPKSRLKRNTMVFLAITIHNIPEGMAVAVSFSIAAKAMEQNGITLWAAISQSSALAVAMALQNFPEGAAVSLPLKADGASTGKAFLYGALSGIVEPIFGVITVLIVGHVVGILPWILSFAAAAMIYVVVDELIPEAHLGDHSTEGTVSVMTGFLVMLILDSLLG